MRILGVAALALALLATLLGGFCWWGLWTEGGRRHFDEMAGLVPFYGGVAGAVALVLSAVLIIWRHWLLPRPGE